MRRAVGLGVLLLLAVPAASAGPVSFASIEGPAFPVMPEVQAAPLVARVDVDCQAVLEWTGFGALGDSVRLDLRVDAPPEILVTGPTTVTVPVQDCLGKDTVEGTFASNVAVTRDLPGLVPHSIGLTVDASTGGALGPAEGEARAEGSSEVTADYFSLIQAKVPEKVQEAERDRATEFAIEVLNFGNARTVVRFDLEDMPPGAAPAEGWDVILPAPLVLEPAGGAEAVLTVWPPRGLEGPAQAAFRLEMAPTAAHDPSKEGAHVSVDLLARLGRRLPSLDPEAAVEVEEAPSAGVTFFSTAVLVAALAARRRR